MGFWKRLFGGKESPQASPAQTSPTQASAASQPKKVDLLAQAALSFLGQTAGHKPRLCGRGSSVGGLPRQFRCPPVQLERIAAQPVFRQHDGRAAERIRLDDVRSGFQVGAVNSQHHVRPRANEVLVAAIERSSAKISRAQVPLLQHRAHGPVEHENPLRQQFAQRPGLFCQVLHPLEGIDS